MQLINDSKLHFDDLLQLSLHNPLALKTCTYSDDRAFLAKLSYKLRKIIDSLNYYSLHDHEFQVQNNGINTRLSSTKIKSIIHLRNVQHLTFKQIAQIIGTSRNTISRIIKQSGNKPASEYIRNNPQPKNIKIPPQICKAVRLFVKLRRGLVTAKTIRDFILKSSKLLYQKLQYTQP